MNPLEPVADNLWAAAAPQPFYGVQVGTRMTVIRLSSGGLLLHSPVPIDETLKSAIDALGPVEHIVCPNLFHHLHAGPAHRLWPAAQLHGPRKLQDKRPDLHFDAVLSEVPHPDWKDDLRTLAIAGSFLQETVFWHPASRTLITCDLIENFHDHSHPPTRLYLRLGGILGKPGWHRLLRMVYWNRRAARASLERILELPIERLVLAHGDIVRSDAREVLREAMRWL